MKGEYFHLLSLPGIFEYFTYESKIISHKALTDLETSYIKRFNFYNLYNFKVTATSSPPPPEEEPPLLRRRGSSLGYKHTEEARLKMVFTSPLAYLNATLSTLSYILPPKIISDIYFDK